MLPIAAHILHDTSCTGGTKFNVIGGENVVTTRRLGTDARQFAATQHTVHQPLQTTLIVRIIHYSVSDVDMKYIELEVVLIQA